MVEDEFGQKKQPDVSKPTEENGQASANAEQNVSDKDDINSELKDKPKKAKNPDNSDESDDDEKAEKNSLDKSFDLSTDEEDELDDQDGGKENNQESEYLDDLMEKKKTEDETAVALLNDKEAVAKVSVDTAGKDEKDKLEAQKKKTQGVDSSNKELARKRKLEQLEEENKKMQVLMANFSEEQLNRYEVFRRSAFQKSTVKKIIQTVSGKTVSASVVIAMSGIAKVYVGEIVEKALDVKASWGDTGPLQPRHMREAYRLHKNESKIASSLRTKNNPIFM